jgi:hypothetical protein
MHVESLAPVLSDDQTHLQEKGVRTEMPMTLLLPILPTNHALYHFLVVFDSQLFYSFVHFCN